MKNIRIIFLSLCFILVPGITMAHSFGALYNLPVPFWMYLYGGAGAMVLSFLVFTYFLDKKRASVSELDVNEYKTISLSKYSFFRKFDNKFFMNLLKGVSLFLFLLTIFSGFIGENSSYSNFNMTFFWVIFVLGLTYVSALIGNVYSSVNPWKILTNFFVGKDSQPIFEYSKSFGYYPALLFYFIFIWLELIGETNPLKLSFILIVYTIINDIGVIMIGKEAWFKYCEFFSVFFRLVSKIAPFEYVDGKFYLRMPFVGLLKESAEHFSLAAFSLFMLSSTAFDGFKETVYWFRFYWKYLDETVRPILGTSSYALYETFGLILSLFLFIGFYLLLIYLSKVIAKSEKSTIDLSLKFVFSLIPIALVYHVAHYYTIIFSEGPNIFRLFLDPFGFGWNPLGIENYPQGIIVGANFVWHSQVAFILLGHIVSVYLTHKVAMNLFSNSKRPFLSQIPMLILMIVYTMAGLWILSQPLVGGAI